MKIKKEIELADFLEAVREAKGDVYLCSQMGDQYNLKSRLSRYIAIGAMIGDNAEDLELFCQNKNDEGLFLNFFNEHPEAI